MTTAAFVLLTLLAWAVSSDTWPSSDRWTKLGQRGRYEETKAFSASRENAVIYDTTKLSCQRSSEIRGERITKDYTLFSGAPLNGVLFGGCADVLHRAEEAVNAEMENRHVSKSKSLRLVVYFLSKTSCLLLMTEVTSDNHGTNLSHRNICPSVLLGSTARCAHITALAYKWKTKHCACVCKVCNYEDKVLQNPVYSELAFPECPVAVLSDNQMLSMFYSTPAGCVCSVRPADSDRWVGRFCLAAVLLLSVYTRTTQPSPNGVGIARESNSTIGMLFTLTLRRFSPSVTVYQQSDWSVTAVCLACAMGRTVHVLIVCRAAHTVMKRFCPMQQHFRTLPVAVLFLWLIFCLPFPRLKNVSTDVLAEFVESTQRSCVLAQPELLATLCCVLVSLTSLLRSILTKLNVLSVLFHVQLVTCLQNSIVPRKYVLTIKISRFI